MRVVIRKPITYELVERSIGIGDNSLVGHRITQLVITDWEEAKKLATPDGMRWFQACVVPAFLSRTQQNQPDEENKPI